MTDFYLLDEKLTDDERGIRDRLRDFCAKEVTPVINGYWERAEFPFELVPKIAALQMAGGTVEGYGCPGMSATAAGLVSMEWARADGSIGTFYGVHSNLAMQSIALLGSEEQKQRWLPKMADLDAIGAFALTEPDHGSDAVKLEWSARREGDEYVLDGRKRWIGNATIADVVIVWARDQDGHVGGYLVEKGTPGFNATVMTGKTALRAVWQADIHLDGVRVPAENKLPGCRNFRDVAGVLSRTRYTVAWRALGMAIGAYESALAYAKEREQFGKPIAAHQLVQEKLVRSLGNITASIALCTKVSRMLDAGTQRDEHSALAKLVATRLMRETVALCRETCGGNGIVSDFGVARFFADAEAVYSYEGTYDMNALIVGRAITGHGAFA